MVTSTAVIPGYEGLTGIDKDIFYHLMLKKAGADM